MTTSTSSSGFDSPFWVRPLPRPGAQWRLYCLPSAGSGSAVFFPWAAEAPDWIEIVALRLPGRESRLREPRFSDLDLMSDAVAATLDDEEVRPWAMFGHSMGALLAAEVIRRREASGLPSPRHLFVSGRHAPHLPEAKEPWHALDDETLRARLHGLGGMPAKLLDDPELRALLFPIIRDDLRACETWSPRRGRPLNCGITAYGGETDPLVSEEAQAAWREHTAGPFESRQFAGGHFFHVERRAEVLAAIAEKLRQLEP